MCVSVCVCVNTYTHTLRGMCVCVLAPICYPPTIATSSHLQQIKVQISANSSGL